MCNKKLIIIDCDGVLYHSSELDINAMVNYAFGLACHDFNISIDDVDLDEICKYPSYYAFIDNLAKQHCIKTDDFIAQMIKHVDYSGLAPDNTGVLQKIQDLTQRYKLCICTNNHIMHVNKILNAKFNICSDQFPCEIFDTRYANLDGVFYSKESDVFISKLEKHFGINARDFLWIDDTQHVIDTVKSAGCNGILVTDSNRLIDILNKL